MADESAAVRVTNRDLYDALQALTQEVVEMRATVKATIDQEARLRDVERRVWALPSAATVMALIALGLSIFKAGGQ